MRCAFGRRSQLWHQRVSVRPTNRAAPQAMLLEHVPALNTRRLVLASASPRRKELLEQLGLKFEVRG